MIFILLSVQVTNVYIQTLSRNLTEEDVLNVTQGEATTLTCITGTSRPDSTIIWYIGSNKQTKTGVPFVFYPRNSDNNRRVYCTAHNLQLEKSAVVSEKPKLYVKGNAVLKLFVLFFYLFAVSRLYENRRSNCCHHGVAILKISEYQIFQQYIAKSFYAGDIN